MLSSLAFTAFVVLSGVSSVAGNALGTVQPCPKCPKSLSIHPITVTKQYQPVSTCVPEKTCHKKKCSSTASCSTYDWVSTTIPCLGGTTSTLITKTDQIVPLAHVSTVLTTYIPYVTQAPYLNGTYGNHTKTTLTSTTYQTMVVDISAPYNECGPLAMPPWGGSGLCDPKKCGEHPEEEKDQPVHVSKCLDGVCSTYAETWVSLKPTSTYSSSALPYSTSAYASKSGVNTIPVTAVITPSGEYTAPCTKTFDITTSVQKPGPVQITKTITVTFTKEPEPTESHYSSKAPVSTTTYCSNGVHTIPIVTTCTPHQSGFTKPVTTTVYYTTTVTDGPKTVSCTKTVTVTYTSTCPPKPPVTVVSGHTYSTAPHSTPAYPTSAHHPTTTPGGYPTGSHGGHPTSTHGGYPTSTHGGYPTSTPSSPAGECEFYGCLGSSTHFDGFSVVESSGKMTVELCQKECKAAGFIFAGLHTTDCYCSGSIEYGTSAEKGQGKCNLPCPGNKHETCGGNSLGSKKRNYISDKILLDVYECKPPTVTASSTTSAPTSDPSSDPDSDPDPSYKRDIDADMEVEIKARDVKLRRGGLLRHAKVQAAPVLNKRNFGLKQPFGQ